MCKIKIGIIGCGLISEVHIKSFKNCSNVEIIGVASATEKSAKFIALKYQIPYYFADYKKLLSLSELDAIVVCTPNYLHYPITMEALDKGKHVLCEKPMAMNTQETIEMLKKAKEKNKLLMYAFVRRYLKEIVMKNKFGKIYHSNLILWRRRGIPGLGGWFTDKNMSGGGVIIDIGVHILDQLLYILGYPKSITVSASIYSIFGKRKKYNYIEMWGRRGEKRFNVEDYGTAFIRLEDDLTITLECSLAANIEKDCWIINILGEKYGARFEWDNKLEFYGEMEGIIADFNLYYKKRGIDEAFQIQADNFIKNILTNKFSYKNAEEGIILQSLIEGIYRSAQKKKEIKLNEIINKKAYLIC